MVKFKLDIHTHTSDFSHFIFMKSNKKEYLLKLLNRLFRKGNHLVVGITNYNNDGRYQKFVKAVELLPKNYVVDKINKDFFISIKKKNKVIYFVRVDEIETDRGHVLIIGNKKKINVRQLYNLLRSSRKKRWIVIADHPLHKTGISYFLISKLLDKKKLSLKEEDLIKNRNDFDTLELNSYFPRDREKIKNLARKENFDLIANSDAHTLAEFFNSYFELENLDFKNIQTFKKSFKKSLKKHVRLHTGKHGLMAEYKHGLEVLFFEVLFPKLGIVKK